jgi:hypothetical protein
VKRVLVAAAVALIAGCGPQAVTPTRTEVPTPTDEAVPSADLGAGTPGAGCSTNRLGKHFTSGGIRYTCKGPKPYAWRSDAPPTPLKSTATPVDTGDGIPCKDGSVSHAAHRRGACAHHGGIA